MCGKHFKKCGPLKTDQQHKFSGCSNFNFNRCIIERFDGIAILMFFGLHFNIWGLCHRTESDNIFSLHYYNRPTCVRSHSRSVTATDYLLITNQTEELKFVRWLQSLGTRVFLFLTFLRVKLHMTDVQFEYTKNSIQYCKILFIREEFIVAYLHKFIMTRT